MTHDPRKLYARINAAAMELRQHGDALVAMTRVVDDIRLAGFSGLADALGGVVAEAKGVGDEEVDQSERIEELEKEVAELERKLEEIRDIL